MKKKFSMAEFYRTRILESDDLHSAQVMSDPNSKINASTDEESQVILLIHQLEELPDVISALQNLNLLSSKYKAIQEFANLLGIKPNEFDAVMQQAKIQSTI